MHRLLLLALLCLADLPAVDLTGATFDSSGLTASGARWERGDRILFMLPTLWSKRDGGWFDQVRNAASGEHKALDLRLHHMDLPTVTRLKEHHEARVRTLRPHVVAAAPGFGDAWWAAEWHGKDMITGDVVRREIRDFVTRLRATGAIVVLVTPPRAMPGEAAGGRDTHMAAMAEAVREIAGEMDCTLVDIHKAECERIAAGQAMIEEEGRLTIEAHRMIASMLLAGIGSAVGAVPFELDLPGGGVEINGSVEIGLRRCAQPAGVEIRYTTDGSEPSAKSPLYKKPFAIAKDCTVKVLATDKARSLEVRAAARYIPMRRRAASKFSRPEVGLIYQVFSLAGDTRKLPDFTTLTLLGSGARSRLDLAFHVDNPAIPELTANFATLWNAALIAPASGVYTLYVRSDDGARLLFDDAVVVENDGLHGMGDEAMGMINLEVGTHEFTLQHFQNGGGQGLELWWEGPGFEKQRVAQTSLCYNPAKLPKTKGKP